MIASTSPIQSALGAFVYFKMIGIIFTVATLTISVWHSWCMYKKHRRYNARLVQLSALRETLEHDHEIIIHIRLLQKNVFDVHGYQVKIPPMSEPTYLTFLSRQTIPKGYYKVQCRSDSFIFTLQENENGGATAHTFALFTV